MVACCRFAVVPCSLPDGACAAPFFRDAWSDPPTRSIVARRPVIHSNAWRIRSHRFVSAIISPSKKTRPASVAESGASFTVNPLSRLGHCDMPPLPRPWRQLDPGLAAGFESIQMGMSTLCHRILLRAANKRHTPPVQLVERAICHHICRQWGQLDRFIQIYFRLSGWRSTVTVRKTRAGSVPGANCCVARCNRPLNDVEIDTWRGHQALKIGTF